MERHFEQELEQLRSKFLAMSALMESAVYRSITAVVQKDRKLAEEVLQNEARLNRDTKPMLLIDDKETTLEFREARAVMCRYIAVLRFQKFRWVTGKLNFPKRQLGSGSCTTSTWTPWLRT